MSSRVLHPSDPAYPAALAEVMPDAPLYLRGELPRVPGICIVGTREATEPALRLAYELAGAMIHAGYAVWSGGALGIDGAAHEGAIAARGATVVVSGSGLDRPYPPEHVALFDRVVASGGALLTHLHDRAPPIAPNFLARNRVLAAATIATVVVQAGVKSGARSTAQAARRCRRLLCGVPHSPWDERGAGCLAEIAAGAAPVRDSFDVLSVLGGAGHVVPPLRRRRADRAAPQQLPLTSGPARPGRAETAKSPERAGEKGPPAACARFVDGPPDLDSTAREVLAVLGSNPVHAEEVCEKTGISYRDASLALLTLTLQAVVVEGPAGLYRRARCC